MILDTSINRLCNMYTEPGKINPATFPAPTICGMIHMGDFVTSILLWETLLVLLITRDHGSRNTLSENNCLAGTLLEPHMYKGVLWTTFFHRLIASQFWHSAVPALSSDYIKVHYTLSAKPSVHTHNHIIVPLKFHTIYILHMSNLLPMFASSALKSYIFSRQCYNTFYTKYISRSRITRCTNAHTWTLDNCIILT